jgi:hypothetical protein
MLYVWENNKMTNSFGSFCDDFYVDLCVNTRLELPDQRDTVLSFFEQLRKRFPNLANFSRREGTEFLLEEERQNQKYRWVSLEKDRISAGCAEPEQLEEAYSLHAEVLELMPYMLGVTSLDVESIDITFTLDFDYQGNHDEVIAEALLAGSGFGSLLELSGAKTIGCTPSMILALSEDYRTQARIAVESRTSVHDLRNEKIKLDEPISLYFTIRRHPSPTDTTGIIEAYRQQCKLAEQLMFDRVLPYFVQPLLSAIAQRR